MGLENRTREVNLGCGTLILIALIVLIFSRTSTDRIERELREIRSEVSQLRRSVDALVIGREAPPAQP